MNPSQDISADVIFKKFRRLFDEAERSGYHLNPDEPFTKELVRGLIINENRYGYQACPCRLASGVREDDLDIICPCDYRDSDVAEFDACYCGLYVSHKILNGFKKVSPVPERRPPEEIRRRAAGSSRNAPGAGGLSLPVWRCKVCGYLCAREEPPETCPICGVKKERFERFM
ncbi:MAG: ferredoxin:glutaredoxin reductase [Spirochaetes bacterium]|nr:ferredoxin:glutaredoxin reductase [Spirochaetota bacterium]